MPSSVVETTVLQIPPTLPRVYTPGSDVVSSRAAIAARRSRSIYLSPPRTAAAAPPSVRAPQVLVQTQKRTRSRPGAVLYKHATFAAAVVPPDYRPRILIQEPQRQRRVAQSQYKHATTTPAAAAADYKPRITTQKPATPQRRPTHNLYQHATFTAAAPAADYRPRITLQHAQTPRRAFRTVLARVVPQAVVVVDRRPQILVQYAASRRRAKPRIQLLRAFTTPLVTPRPAQTIKLAASQPSRWRRSRIITLIRRLTAGAPVGAAPPVTIATHIDGPTGRTRLAGSSGATDTIGLSGATHLTGDDGATHATGTSGKTVV